MAVEIKIRDVSGMSGNLREDASIEETENHLVSFVYVMEAIVKEVGGKVETRSTLHGARTLRKGTSIKCKVRSGGYR